MANLSNKYKQKIVEAETITVDDSGLSNNYSTINNNNIQAIAEETDSFNYWTALVERESDLLLSSGNIGEIWMRIDSSSPTIKIIYDDSSSGLVKRRLTLV
jgi:hypothetical protein